MEKPTLEEITELQAKYGLTELQDYINNGMAWTLEGSVGRSAMSSLEQGACILPEEQHRDYYGSIVPSRTDLVNGTKGTMMNAQIFWEKVLDGEIELECTEDE